MVVAVESKKKSNTLIGVEEQSGKYEKGDLENHPKWHELLPFAYVFFFKQKTAYEISVRDWSSDVCSPDLRGTATAVLRSRCRARCAERSPMSDPRRRSEERRVGKECERLCRSRWSPYH